MVRELMPRALGWTAVPGCRSTRSEVTPSRESRMEAVRPTGPPPTIRTSTSRIRGTCRVRAPLSKPAGDATVARGEEPIRDDIQSDTTATIVIDRLATGPTPPRPMATWPNVLHTRIAEVVKQMGAAAVVAGGSSRTSATS